MKLIKEQNVKSILVLRREEVPFLSDQLLEHLCKEDFGVGKKQEKGYLLKTDLVLQGGIEEHNMYNNLVQQIKADGYDTLFINL